MRFNTYFIKSFMLWITLTTVCFADSTSLALSSIPTPFLGEADLPKRTAPLLEIGDPLLGPGPISQPHISEWGWVWNERLWIYGEFRSAYQGFRTGIIEEASAEWANRLDLFANWQFSGTERFLFGMRPLNQDNEFTRYVFNPNKRRGFKENVNARLTTFFFEGDVSQIFANWQKKRKTGRDIGFAIGRQPIVFQEGIFINDFIDAIGVTQNSLSWGGMVNAQYTVYVGLGNIDRHDNRPDHDATLFGFHSRFDKASHTLDFDIAYVHSDLWVVAASTVQRIGRVGTSWRLLASIAPNEKTEQANDGVLLFLENNFVPANSHDIFYINTAWALGHFTSVARDSTVGGPLGRLGILFASAGIGEIGSAISSQANNVWALAMGYQRFFTDNLQGIVEVGGRLGLDHQERDVLGVSALLQRGFGRRTVASIGAFTALREHQKPAFGLRTEVLVKF